MKKKDLWVHALFMIMVLAGWSCQVTDQELGTDLLPPDDEVFLFHDTIFEISASPVTGQPVLTHESGNSTRLFWVGATSDTIVGTTRTTLFTQFNTSSAYRNGPNLTIDSLVLYLYVDDYIGDTTQRMTIRVHEMTERIYRDSVYYSDYEAEGRYDPVPLAENSFTPKSHTLYAFRIEDQEYLDQFYSRETDTTVFRNDSIFKSVFKGFYITGESESQKGTLAGIQLNHSRSRVSIKYASDSTEVDTTAGQDFVWTNFSIDQFASQKVGIYEHDHSGTYLSGIIDREDADSRSCYVQGLAGVNTRLSLDNLQEWIDKGEIAINSATLIFDVVPEAVSGLPIETLPERLMVLTARDEGDFEYFYDYISLSRIDDVASRFGGYLRPRAESMFADTTYTYRFNMTLHFQALLDEDRLLNHFSLQVEYPRDHPEVAKVWSNHPANPNRLRLEVVYLKL
jgi:hypothetical protein